MVNFTPMQVFYKTSFYCLSLNLFEEELLWRLKVLFILIQDFI